MVPKLFLSYAPSRKLAESLCQKTFWNLIGHNHIITWAIKLCPKFAQKYAYHAFRIFSHFCLSNYSSYSWNYTSMLIKCHTLHTFCNMAPTMVYILQPVMSKQMPAKCPWTSLHKVMPIVPIRISSPRLFLRVLCTLRKISVVTPFLNHLYCVHVTLHIPHILYSDRCLQNNQLR